MEEQVVKLLIAEDQPLIRAGLQHVFGTTKKFKIVADASTLLQAYQLCQQLHPDILLLSLNLLPFPTKPTLNDLRNDYPQLKLLLMGGDCEDDCLRDLLNAGVAGYVLKSDPTEAINAAIHAIAKGGSYYSHAALTSINRILFSQEDRRRVDPMPQLTKRELQIINLLARGMDNRMIARELNLAYQTVRNRLYTIYKKLGVQSRAEAIIWANQQLLI